MIIRPYRMTELEAVYNMIKATTATYWLRRVSHNALRSLKDPEREAIVATENDGEIVGFAWWEIEKTPDGDSLLFQGWVHPKHIRRGIGTALLVGVEDFARGAGVAHLKATAITNQPGAVPLFVLRGFAEQRRFSQMWVEIADKDYLRLLNPPPEYAIRNWLDADMETFISASNAAFSEHWGGIQITHEALRMRISDSIDFSPDRFVLICKGREIVAFCLGESSPLNGKPDDGWVWQLGVVPSFRGLGLGRAALANGLFQLQKSGYQRVGLHVDDQNDAAIHLYSSFGMQSLRQRVHFAKQLV